MSFVYEWVVEIVEEDGEIIDHRHFGSYAEAVQWSRDNPEPGTHHETVLVATDWDRRGWAYVVDGALPAHFKDALGNCIRQVPQRFIREVEK